MSSQDLLFVCPSKSHLKVGVRARFREPTSNTLSCEGREDTPMFFISTRDCVQGRRLEGPACPLPGPGAMLFTQSCYTMEKGPYHPQDLVSQLKPSSELWKRTGRAHETVNKRHPLPAMAGLSRTLTSKYGASSKNQQNKPTKINHKRNKQKQKKKNTVWTRRGSGATACCPPLRFPKQQKVIFLAPQLSTKGRKTSYVTVPSYTAQCIGRGSQSPTPPFRRLSTQESAERAAGARGMQQHDA